MDLEKLAISAVMDCISRTDFLEPFLETGDKIPSWDGHIYFFKDKKHSKEGMTRIPVQVKGQDSKNVRNIQDTIRQNSENNIPKRTRTGMLV